MKQINTGIGMHVQLDMPYDEAIRKVTEALKVEGFGVLTQIDVKETLNKKLGIDFERYIILGACNPALAHRALDTDLDAGLLLPCNVTVRELGQDRADIGVIDPIVMLGVMAAPALEPIAQEARARLERVVGALKEG